MYTGDDHHRVFGVDGQNVQFVDTQTGSLPYVYYTPGYGYAQSLYNPYNPSIPGAVMAADGSYVATQQYYMPSYENGTSSPMVVQPGFETYTSGTTDQYYDMSAASTASWVDPSGVNSNSFSAAGAYPMNSTANFGVTSNSVSGPASSQMLQGRGAHATGNFTNGETVSNYSQLKVTLPAANGVSNFGSSGNARVLVDKGRSKLPLVKVTNEVNGTPNALTEQNRGPRSRRAHLRVKAYYSRARDQYNKDDFPIDYVNAKFFVIKPYSEDDVHKSIKYNVWSSTPNGNKKLNSAYEEAQKISVGDPKGCPIFLCFSVNASGQFCGVAEMTGPVDFHKDKDFWQQDKWSGSFLVKWHIIKDVPDPHFRHIILENNEHKPVTNSRDTQEIEYKKGLEVLKVFKSYTSKTCLLDDFMYYENRHKKLQDEKARLLMRSSVTRKRKIVAFLHPPHKLNNFFDVASSGDEKSGKDNHIDTSDSNVSTFANGKPTEDDVLRFSSLAISPGQKETTVTGGATSVSAVSITDSDNVLTVGSMPVKPKHNGFAESSGFLTVGTIPLDPKALKVKEASASAEIGLRKNLMEGVSVCDSSVNQPESERVRPLALTKEEITALNNFTVTFEHARSLFDADLPTFKAKLIKFNILVWNEPDGIPLRIHGGDYVITIVINKISTYYHAAEGSKLRGYFVRLNLNTSDEQTVALMGIYDECIRDHVHDSDYAPYHELPFYCLPNEDASYKDAYASLRAAYDEHASHEYSSDEYSSDDEAHGDPDRHICIILQEPGVATRRLLVILETNTLIDFLNIIELELGGLQRGRYEISYNHHRLGVVYIRSHLRGMKHICIRGECAGLGLTIWDLIIQRNRLFRIVN
ncbi:YTH domain-containing protein [Artemisia annua]|uniref:YTH domain-containing protein n=1 Tax=Artemisia annua TaxID=35608 RepID=A0A2U1MRH6_ARTAN|nr:YTH domain-containing protein [Artemisia annua]